VSTYLVGAIILKIETTFGGADCVFDIEPLRGVHVSLASEAPTPSCQRDTAISSPCPSRANRTDSMSSRIACCACSQRRSRSMSLPYRSPHLAALLVVLFCGEGCMSRTRAAIRQQPTRVAGSWIAGTRARRCATFNGSTAIGGGRATAVGRPYRGYQHLAANVQVQERSSNAAYGPALLGIIQARCPPIGGRCCLDALVPAAPAIRPHPAYHCVMAVKACDRTVARAICHQLEPHLIVLKDGCAPETSAPMHSTAAQTAAAIPFMSQRPRRGRPSLGVGGEPCIGLP
jgi:hypothetical protein